MESSRKRLGLIKGKLVKSLYRAAAVASKPIQHDGFVANQVMDRPSTIHHLHQNQNHQPIKQKLVPYNPNSTTFSSSTTSAAPPDQSTHDREYSNSSSSTSTATTYYAKATLDNESVDLKAASYISSVQERFRLERVNSERKAQCF
ncbi:hypothetical protein MTR67_008634 [Solanum verrucosum]|uniref:Uncharacterized protein n=1 Tax=Solanum verrucosum TaxID=315347 RepID=A0AAF0TE39_SOLVR|nr:hypothetical protein MTR67_008634 [Solanum verrucosum]